MKRGISEFIHDSGSYGVGSELAALVAFFIGVWEHTHNSPLTAFLFLGCSVPLFWIGAFFAWRKKRDELESEKMSHSLVSEWRFLETRFKAQSPHIMAGFTRSPGPTQDTWNLHTEIALEPSVKQECATLMEHAGKLLSKSQHARMNYTESLLATNPIDRWLNVVMVITGAKSQIVGRTTRFGVETESHGYIAKIAAHSAVTCLHFATQEIKD
jgi:hypothetical protein